jgi:hypothetical protein
MIMAAALLVGLTAATIAWASGSGPQAAKGEATGAFATSSAKSFQLAGSVSTSSVLGSCSDSLFDDFSTKKTLVLDTLVADASDTVKPEIVLWLRQQTGSGYFTHYQGVPLTTFTVTDIYSGVLALNVRLLPGSFTAGDISASFICVTPGGGDTATSGRYILTGHVE